MTSLILVGFSFYVSLYFRMKNFETNDLAFFPKENFGDNSGLAAYVAKAIDPSLSWEDIKWLKELTSLPVVAKGILRGSYISLLEFILILWFFVDMIMLFLRENDYKLT